MKKGRAICNANVSYWLIDEKCHLVAKMKTKFRKSLLRNSETPIVQQAIIIFFFNLKLLTAIVKFE